MGGFTIKTEKNSVFCTDIFDAEKVLVCIHSVVCV